MIELDASLFNGLAGLAALVNSLLMWPTIKGLRDLGKTHNERIVKLEDERK